MPQTFIVLLFNIKDMPIFYRIVNTIDRLDHHHLFFSTIQVVHSLVSHTHFATKNKTSFTRRNYINVTDG